MDQFERLAAFLADELDTDERTALERELAHHPDLRRDLAAMRRADEALTGLPSPSPNLGFEARIDAALDAELRDLLGDTASPTTTPATSPGPATGLGSGDRFVARHRERATRPVRALVGVAAGVAVLAVGGVAVTQFDRLGGSDTEDSMAMDAQLESDADAADDSAALSVAPARAPVLVDEDREIDDEALDALLAAPELETVRGDALDSDSGRELAAAFQTMLGAGAGGADGGGVSADDAGEAADAPEAAEQAPAEESSPSDDAAGSDRTSDPEVVRTELFSRDGRRLPAEATDDVARCLAVLLDADRTAIPVYAELATYQATEVIVFGLVTLDPATNSFSRTEVWALDRTDCQVLRFSQS